MKKLMFGIVATLVIAVSSMAQAEDASQSMEMKCKLGNDERLLIIVPKESGCDLYYQKFGKSEVTARSASGQKPCEKVRRQMRTNLEAAGYKCQ